MIKFRLFVVYVTAAGLFAVMPAAAAVKIAKYSGIVASGFDQTGVFAAPGSELAGYSWIATYTYDKKLGGYNYTDNITYSTSYGGPYYGEPGTPIISASITINGVTRSIAGAYAGSVTTDNSDNYVQHIAQDDDYNNNIYSSSYIYNYGRAVGAPVSLNQNFGPVALAVDFDYGYMAVHRYNTVTGEVYDFAVAALGGNTVYSVSNVVPEPASWALMIAGFGLVGAAARRNRRVETRHAIA